MNRRTTWAVASAIAIIAPLASGQSEIVVVGGTGRHCGEDPGCINRLHPQIPMAARAVPGQTILFKARNASDFDLDPDSSYDDPRAGDPQIGTVHPLAGPVHIEGGEAGDVLAVTLLDIDPGPFGYTVVSPMRPSSSESPCCPLPYSWRYRGSKNFCATGGILGSGRENPT